MLEATHIGSFLAGALVVAFAVFLLARYAKKKYDVVERPPSSGGGSGGGSGTGSHGGVGDGHDD